MKTIMISGSRNPSGQTATAGKAVLAGLADKGVACEEVYLPTLKIERCRQCNDTGWGICRSEGRCIIEDDFAAIAQKLREADVVVFATPVYFHELSESLRAFLDRFRRITRGEGFKQGVAGKPAVGVCVAGGSGNGAPNCCMSLDRALVWCGYFVAEMAAIRRQNLQAKLPGLRQIGQWLADAADDLK